MNGRLIPEFPMPELKKVSKKVVFINELKPQIDKMLEQDAMSVSIALSSGVEPSWSRYPCAKKKCVRYNLNFCDDGKIGITIRTDGKELYFPLKLLAIRDSEKTYIIQDGGYDKLIDSGKVKACNIQLVHYFEMMF